MGGLAGRVSDAQTLVGDQVPMKMSACVMITGPAGQTLSLGQDSKKLASEYSYHEPSGP